MRFLWLRYVVPFPRLVIGIFIILFIAGEFSGFAYGNMGGVIFPLFGLLLGLLLFCVLAFLFSVFGESGNGSYAFLRACEKDLYLPYRAFVIPLLPAVLISILGACSFPDGQSMVWVVDGRAMQERHTVFAVPFLQDIRNVQLSHHVITGVTATTKDGAPIEAFLRADMRIVSDSSIVVRILRDFNGDNAKVTDELNRVLQKKFQQAVATLDLKELSNTLVIEWQTGKGFDEETLSVLGVEWNGTLRVSDISIRLAKPKIGSAV